MASTRSASFDFSHFDRAIKSSVSTLGDKCTKEITSLHRKVIPGFLKVHLTPKFFFGRDETVQHSHKEFDNFISIW